MRFDESRRARYGGPCYFSARKVILGNSCATLDLTFSCPAFQVILSTVDTTDAPTVNPFFFQRIRYERLILSLLLRLFYKQFFVSDFFCDNSEVNKTLAHSKNYSRVVVTKYCMHAGFLVSSRWD